MSHMTTENDRIADDLREVLDPETPAGQTLSLVMECMAANAAHVQSITDSLWAGDMAPGLMARHVVDVFHACCPSGGTTAEYERWISLLQWITFPPPEVISHYRQVAEEIVAGTHDRLDRVPLAPALQSILDSRNAGVLS